ncbi:MAG: hypothetical protein ACRYGR_01620 [Janthinobacterium lividum]
MHYQNRPTIALAMQGGFVALHWWWVFVLASPGKLIVPGGQYAAFAVIGNDVYWLWRAVIVAMVATVSMLPVWRRGPLIAMSTIQVVWLCLLSVLYFRVYPYTTGPGAYLVMSWFAVIIAVVCWRHKNAGRGRAT